jgi:hypothetical protein
MALIIENGTGVSGADSFVTVAECEAFALAYFGASLAGSPTAKESALRRAFGYMRSLSWCDADAFPTFGGTIPQAVKDAQHIFARAEFQKVNALQPSVTQGQGKILNRVGQIGWQVTGGSSVNAQRQTVTMAMDRLKGLVCASGPVQFLERG